jgi:hypothetical protein
VAARATWVWERPAPDELLNWVRDRSVTEVFLGVGADLGPSGEYHWVRPLVELLREHGVRVAALGGDTAWIRNSDPALAWQRAVVATGLFDAVHLDIEVWDRDDWPDIPAADVAAYLALLGVLAADRRLPLEADIAFHLHLVPTATRDSLQTAVMRVVDAVTVLSYRNFVTGPDSITDISASARADAQRLSVPCRLAVETKYLGDDPAQRKQTFHSLGPAALQSAMTQVDTLVGSASSYAGVAVHDYAHWRVL